MANEAELYKIVSATTINELQEKVRAEMRADWEPLGGVAVDDDLIYQAMVPRGD